MKTWQRLGWLKPFSLTLLLLFAATAGRAEDTEIYYSSSKAGVGNVNLMFLLDTSGSMAWCRTSDDDDCTTAKVRMNILHQVFSQLIDGMGGNINVGVGAFSASGYGSVGGGDYGNGGYVLYPMRGLDAAAGKLAVGSSISSGADDGTGGISGSVTDIYDGAGLAFPSGGTADTGTGLIFRGIHVPTYAKIKSATLTVQAKGASADALDMSGYYSIGSDLPDLSQQALNARTWGPMVTPPTPAPQVPVLTGVPISVSDTWTDKQRANIDITQLVQSAVNDAGWCGGDDMLLGFTNKDTSSVSARAIGTQETAGDNGTGYLPASISIEWDLQATPAQADSCNGDLASNLADDTNDAEEQGFNNNKVYTNGSAILLQNNAMGGFRFPGIRYGNGDTVVKAVLRLPGDGSTMEQTTKQCWAYSNNRWRFATSTDKSRNDSGSGYTECSGSYKSRCRDWDDGECDRWYNSSTNTFYVAWRDITDTAPIPTGKNVTFTVSVVKGNAAAIQSNQKDISGRTVLASADITVSADNATWKGNVDLDVTSLAQQALASGDWTANGALMFVVKPKTLPDSSAQFYVKTVDSGTGASLIMTMKTPDMTKFVQLVRDQLKAAVNSLKPYGGTPLSESYSEMARYLMGKDVNYGDGQTHSGYRYSTDYALSNPESTVSEAGATYETPLGANASCAANAVIVMTDGASNSDEGTNAQVKAITGNACSVSDDSGKNDYACMAELSGWLNKDSNTLKLPVQTNMVGFYLDNTTLGYMDMVSKAGGGKTYAADSADSLLKSFQAIINSVVDTNATLAAPGVAVNQLNRLQNLNDLYYAVFKPTNVSVWPGNMKKYMLGGTAENPQVQDVNGNDAVDPNTGFFKGSAKSYWSPAVDGQRVDRGGALSVLQKDQNALSSGYARKLFVTTAAVAAGTTADATSVSTTALTQITDFSSVAATKLGFPADNATDADRTKITDWLMNAWGDPLHSEPQLVNYGYTGTYEAAAADTSKQENVIYVSDNDGLLHAVNANTGKELFAFSPAEELVKSVNRQSIDSTQSPQLDNTTHHRPVYGLDSSWTIWRRANTSDDSKISAVYLYGGERRGGSNVYALDVTDPGLDGTPVPKMLWQISASGSGPFSILGQTWSQPKLGKVRLNGKDVPVVVFAGGYDDAEDDASTVNTTGNSKGNAIYIVNAFTGALIWYTSSTQQGTSSSYGFTKNADMKWSMPANVSLADVDADGYFDFIYAADVAGQIFRVDLDNNLANTSVGVDKLVKGVNTLAKLGRTGGTADLDNNRRFFSAPTLALNKRNGVNMVQLVIGSGYRAHPLSETTQNMVFGLDDTTALNALQAIKDENASGYTTAVAAQATVTTANFVDVTSLTSTDANQVGINDGSASPKTYGWLLKLTKTDLGEKSLSDAVILQGKAVFTTFTTEKKNVDACSSVQGGARLYVVNLANGLAPEGFDSGNGDVGSSGDSSCSNGRCTDINVPGIPPKPQVLLANLTSSTPSNNKSICGMQASNFTALIGPMALNLGKFDECGLQRTGWFQSTPDKVNTLFNAQGAVEP